MSHAIELIVPKANDSTPKTPSSSDLAAIHPYEHGDSPSGACSEDQPVWRFGSHCPELDGVRGIAILLVTLYRFLKEWDPSTHWALSLGRKYCEFGERGVDLFFVLSGFLITGILLQTKSRPGYFRNFIIRRSLRIFPLYFASLIVCLLVLPGLLGTNVFDQARSHQAYLWTYTMNFYMSHVNAWCFGPLDHFWSLAVEEHFYLIWPAIVFCLSSKALLRLTVGIVVAVCAARTACALRPEYGLAIDTLSLFRFDSLALGAMLAVLLKSGVSASSVDRRAKWMFPLLVLVALAVAWSGKRFLGIPHTLYGCMWAVAMAIVVTRTRAHWLSRGLRAAWLQWLGKYSYGMYVVQLPLVTLLPLSAVAARWPWHGLHPVIDGVAYVLLMFAMTCAIALASFHGLEKPFLNLKRWFAGA